MSVAKGFRLSDDSTAKLDWNYVTKPDGTKSIIEEVNDVKQDLSDLEDRVEVLEEGGGGSGGLTADLKAALDQLAQKVAYIDDDGQDYYDALHNALYPPAELSSISAIYTQSGTVYPSTSLDSLKSDLVVTAHYTDSTSEAVTSYTLSGTLSVGTSTVTVSYGGKTTTFNVTVSAVPTLSSISATYTQSGTVYDTDSIDSLKNDLVVTATWSDSSTSTVASTDYTLSGTLTEGTSTITVSYGGKTTTFDVTVSHVSETVTVPFSDSSLSPVTGKLIKADGTEATISTGSYVALPYYEGMIITTVATSNWTNYAFLVLYNGSTYTKVDLTDGTTSGTVTKYVTTLSGYSNIVSVYANYKTSEKSQCKYQYES